MTLVKPAALAFIALLAGLANAGAQTDRVPFDALARQLGAGIPPLMARGGVPGLAAALILDGRLAWRGEFGVMDAATGRPVTAATKFPAASLTKQLFAYTVLRLADRGVIDLDASLAASLPSARLAHDVRYRQITARLALSHGTGLPNWGGARLELLFDPGTDWEYSGEGDVYLQRTLEHLTGRDLATLVQDEVFAPLGLSQSGMAQRHELEEHLAVGHDIWGRSLGRSLTTEVNAAWSLITTADDYARFLVALMNGRGLRAATVRDALTRQRQVASWDHFQTADRLYWGLGWGLQSGSGSDALWQWGHQDGFRAYRAYMVAFPDRQDAFVYFTNGNTGLSIAHDVLAQVAAGLRDQGRAADAMALLTRNIELHPTSAEALVALGAAQMDTGRLHDAHETYGRAVALDDEHPEATRARTWLIPAIAPLDDTRTVTTMPLGWYVGTYGTLQITLEQGTLFYRDDAGTTPGRSSASRRSPTRPSCWRTEGRSGSRL